MPRGRWLSQSSGTTWLLSLSLLSCLLFVSLHPVEAQDRIANKAAGSIRLVSSSADSVVLEFIAPEHTVTEVVVGEQTFVQVSMPGLAWTDEPGKPQLLQAGAWIGLPATSTPTTHILDVEHSTVHLEHRVYPAPVPVPIGADLVDGGQATYHPNVLALDPETYARDGFYPETPVAIDGNVWLRDRRIGLVQLWPVRYHPVRAELDIIQRIVIEVRFNALGVTANHASGVISPFDHVLRSKLLNYETARNWETASPDHSANTAWNAPASRPNSYKIMVAQDGLYVVTFADLESAGLPVKTLDPRTLRLFLQGQEIAIRVTGQQDGVFNPDDRLYFYGLASHSRYTRTNIYWLCYGGQVVGLRMGTRPVSPANQARGVVWSTARYEEDVFYDSQRPAADNDHWYAAKLMPEESHSATLDLMPLATTVSTATLQVLLVGSTSDPLVQPDHHVTLAVNGQPVNKEWWWDGKIAITATVTLNRSMLRAGSNVVDVFVPGDTGAFGEAVLLDAIEIDYPLQSVSSDETAFSGQSGEHLYQLGGFANSSVWLYDVTNPSKPVLLLGGRISSAGSRYVLSFADSTLYPGRYLALSSSRFRRPAAIEADTPSSLHAVSNGADYLVITHANFSNALKPLAAHRRAQGLRVMTVDVQDVYDEFSGGLMDPGAIRDAISYAYAHWTAPTLTFVLLVGDGHYDPLNHYGYGLGNYIPPYLGMVDPQWGETAADNQYATVSGTDLVADVLLGRLPVNSVADAETVVQKILSYEQSPQPGDWNAYHVFVADNIDAAGDFGASADAVRNSFVTNPWVADKVYLDELSAAVARQRTLSAWNRGALLVSFVGHSSWHQWATEALLHIHDVSKLRNGSKLPVLLSMTCFTGFFHHPEYGTLDEMLLRSGTGGAVATWSPSGLGVSIGHQHLHKGFYQAVFASDPMQIGAATLAAKLHMYSQTPFYGDLLNTYHLFGDPAMMLNLTIRPWPYSTFLPFMGKNASGG